MDEIKQVLAPYGIIAVDVQQISNRLYKVSDGKNTYALKKSHLLENNIDTWSTVFHQAYMSHLTSILPVYLTRTNDMFSKLNGNYYYMTPWIDEKRTEKGIGQILKSLGQIHNKTKYSTGYASEQVKKQFRSYREQCINYKRQLLFYIETFEDRRYMSPVELMICTQYRDMEQVFLGLDASIERFIEIQQEQHDWNYCLCHGNLSPSHILLAEQVYFINWETTCYHNPVFDLSVFLKSHSETFDGPAKAMLNQFENYMHENKLDTGEIYLLAIYLLDPKEYMELIERYYENHSDISIVDQVKHIQHAFRSLQFGLEWLNYVQKELDQIMVDELEED